MYHLLKLIFSAVTKSGRGRGAGTRGLGLGDVEIMKPANIAKARERMTSKN